MDEKNLEGIRRVATVALSGACLIPCALVAGAGSLLSRLAKRISSLDYYYMKGEADEKKEEKEYKFLTWNTCMTWGGLPIRFGGVRAARHRIDKVARTILEKDPELENYPILNKKVQQKKVPCNVNVVSVDHPGIVHEVSEFFSHRNINIEELNTEAYSAAHTGSPMFSITMAISVPAELHISRLREEFVDFCDSLNMDATLNTEKH